LLLLFGSGKKDLFETIEEKAGEKRTIFEKNEKSRKVKTWKEQREKRKKGELGHNCGVALAWKGQV
jgi:hypothetical protein